MPILSRIGAAAARGFGMLGKLATAVDPYFKYVTLLLPGNGTNGAQNNTFLDSSTNNFTITRNGNTTQGTFAPYGSNWSNYFDGTGDYLTTPTSGQFAPSGDFTIGCWIYPVAAASGNFIGNYTANVSTDWQLNRFTDGTLYVYTNGSSVRISSASNALPLNTWSYVAVCRSGSTITAYINGTSVGTYSQSGTFGSATKTIGIGANGAAVNPFTGYISNVLLVDGSAITTVPTSPSTAVTGTKLLTCQSNRFIDNSSNAFTITRNGDTSVQRFSPFAPTAPYAAGTDGGSGYFDGSGDYLTAPSDAALAVGSTFTVECWVYRTVGSTVQWIAGNNAGSGNTSWLIEIEADNTVYGGGWTTGTQTSSTVPVAAWTHIAMVCNSGSLKIYINGVQSGTAATSINFTTSATTYIGQYSAGTRNLTGYISNLRVLKGTALYTADFTPPTSPLTAITNTSLLLSYTNGGIIDNAMMNDLETVGNAQISTTQSKFGGASMYLDGNGDTLALAANINLAMGSGDFTIEMWVYGANSGSPVGGSYPRIFTFGTAQGAGCIESYNAAGTMYVDISGAGGPITFTASTLLNSTWNHYAIARSGTSLKAFVNGTQVGSATNSTNINLAATTQSWIGAISASAGNFNGYIDDLRITKGYARYTANFTPPTQALPTQ